MASAKDGLKIELCILIAYLIVTSCLVGIGLQFFSEFSRIEDYLFWALTGAMLLPWSIASGYLGMASLHAGDYDAVRFSLFIGIILNVFLLHYFLKRLRNRSGEMGEKSNKGDSSQIT